MERQDIPEPALTLIIVTFFVLDLCFDILNAVRWLDFQGDGLSCQSFDEDLHATSETQNEMESGLLLDIVVGQSTAILELFACEDEPLLVGRDSYQKKS